MAFLASPHLILTFIHKGLSRKMDRSRESRVHIKRLRLLTFKGYSGGKHTNRIYGFRSQLSVRRYFKTRNIKDRKLHSIAQTLPVLESFVKAQEKDLDIWFNIFICLNVSVDFFVSWKINPIHGVPKKLPFVWLQSFNIG